MIYLQPQNRSSLGEDTFWTWFKREFDDSTFDLPPKLGARDYVLQYSTLGASNVDGGIKVGLLWELHPEIAKQKIEGEWDRPLEKIRECDARSDLRVVSSKTMLEFHPGAVEMPIGVDTDLFRPMDKMEMRRKHRIDERGTVAFWSGTTHQMKGYDRLCAWRQSNPGVVVIECMKDRAVAQQTLAELMNCADFALFTGRLRPYFMVEWEAMACDLPVVDISGMERDFVPGGREKVLDLGWSRHQAKETWRKFLQ